MLTLARMIQEAELTLAEPSEHTVESPSHGVLVQHVCVHQAVTREREGWQPVDREPIISRSVDREEDVRCFADPVPEFF